MQEDTYLGETQDPLSLNLYTYCANNPLIYYDPTGHVWETIFDIAGVIVSAYDMFFNPSWANFAYLLWDIGAVAVPGVPGSYVADGVKILGQTVTRTEQAISLAQTGAKITRAQEALISVNNGVKLANNLKDALRREARKFMRENSSKYLALVESGMDMRQFPVHHLVPLEWAHLMGKNFDPNSLDNLVAVNRSVHNEITKLWNNFKKAYPTPTPEQIYDQVDAITRLYGDMYIR